MFFNFLSNSGECDFLCASKFQVEMSYFTMFEMTILYSSRILNASGRHAICYNSNAQHKDDGNDGATNSGKPLR